MQNFILLIKVLMIPIKNIFLFFLWKIKIILKVLKLSFPFNTISVINIQYFTKTACVRRLTYGLLVSGCNIRELTFSSKQRRAHSPCKPPKTGYCLWFHFHPLLSLLFFLCLQDILWIFSVFIVIATLFLPIS